MPGNPFFSRFTGSHGRVALAAMWIVCACSPAEQPTPDADPAHAEANPDAKQEAKSDAKSDAKAETPPGSDAEVAKPEGDLEAIEACANYIKLYRACSKKEMPTSQRKLFLIALENQTRAWKQVLADSSKSEVVAGECRAALKGAQVATEDYDCTWK